MVSLQRRLKTFGKERKKSKECRNMRREEGISSIGFKNIKVTDLLKKFG